MPSPSELTTWCSEGNLDGIRDFLENDFPLLPPEGRTAYCAHTSQQNHQQPQQPKIAGPAAYQAQLMRAQLAQMQMAQQQRQQQQQQQQQRSRGQHGQMHQGAPQINSQQHQMLLAAAQTNGGQIPRNMQGVNMAQGATAQQGPCTVVPCHEKLTQLAIAAAEADQVEVFAYLWDTYLAGDDAEIPWAALKAAARHGSIPLAEAFYCRDPTCFTRAVLKASHGRVLGGSQVKVALLHGHLNYIDFLLAHGADINAEFPDQSPVRAAVRSDGDEETAMTRIRFLVDRGAWVNGSGALTSAAGLGRLDAVAFLIEKGADVEDLGDESTEIHRPKTSALLAAAESGHEAIVRLLVKYGANVTRRDDLGRSAVDLAESNGHTRLAELLRPA
ncbi:ankyrin repeat domain-containing protein [Aspergillus affinis]|uniref:ankyrin repeat domain-containing protein n=1 Tax=Aspergillus affinis TaxID=1070780 RepID=UPI0022FEC85A|nr:ankyrin [Aspergillus affinis]KAI9041349.1 ankyrin [Aspergillus affinis]